MSDENIIYTEFDFTLPKGLVDSQGGVHRQGVMRLATAKDEMFVQKDRRVRDEPAYGALIMLSRVITRLGGLNSLNPELLENLFTLDLAYLRDFYNRINGEGNIFFPVQCPECNHQFQVEMALSGES